MTGPMTRARQVVPFRKAITVLSLNAASRRRLPPAAHRRAADTADRSRHRRPLASSTGSLQAVRPSQQCATIVPPQSGQGSRAVPLQPLPSALKPVAPT